MRATPSIAPARLVFALLLFLAVAVCARAQSPYATGADFAKYAMKLRETALLKIEPQVMVPTSNRSSLYGGRYPWKTNIVTTIFWVGERPTQNNPVPNNKSSWDSQWQSTYGGFDNPEPSARRNFLPIAFTPRENPFYVALPYNDVTHSTTKPEAPMVIPWFKEVYKKFGESVCRNRWLAIRNRAGRVCYAQWTDCGPFRTDHWAYVFGNERPKPNLNSGAGLDISPAVRDYLGFSGTDVTDWKFVDFRDIPPGPWSLYGENNDFVLAARRSGTRVAKGAGDSPTVIAR